MMRILLVSILLLCTSCIQLGGGPQQPTNYYLLESLAETRPATGSASLRVLIAPIDFPSYLDRPQIVSRDQKNLILISDHKRWAEPLSDNLNRILRENLFKQLPGAQINTAPWQDSSSPTHLVKLAINRFDGILRKQTEVDIRWSLHDLQNDTKIAGRQFLAQLPIGDDHQGLIDGLNDALNVFSQEIATALLDH